MEEFQEINIQFVLACRRNDVEEAERLLKLGADVNFRFPVGNLTALHCAVKKGALGAVKFLLAQDTLDVKSQSSEKKLTALHMSCKLNYNEISLMLINDPRSKWMKDFRDECLLEMRDSLNRMPLHYACQQKNEVIVNALLEFPIYSDLDYDLDDLVKLSRGNSAIKNKLYSALIHNF